MKKLKKILISVCVVAMLMGCLSVSAFAAVTGYTNEYFVYQIESGNTMIDICKAAGIDFASNYPWIMAVNNITNFNNIKAGQVIYLPRFDTSKNLDLANQLVITLNPKSQAAKMAAMMGYTVPTTTTPVTATVAVPVAATATVPVATATGVTTVPVATTTAVPVVTTTAAVSAPVAVTAQAGDTVVSYLVNHVMRSGETVGGICNALGVSFDANKEQIKKLSNITNWNNIPVGKTVVIPSLVAPAGSSYTAIVAHRVVGGETVGSICARFGLDFGKVQNQLKALNNTDNLNVIKAGQIFYVPVPGAAAVAATTVATTGIAAPVGTVATATSMADAAAQNVQAVAAATSQMAAGTSAHGSFVLQVNGQNVTAATSGQTVTIVATPEAGYTVNTVTVLKDKGTASVPVNGMSFVMPNSAISVNVTFKKA